MGNGWQKVWWRVLMRLVWRLERGEQRMAATRSLTVLLQRRDVRLLVDAGLASEDCEHGSGIGGTGKVPRDSTTERPRWLS